MALDSGSLRSTTVVTRYELCGQRREFPIDLRLQIDEITRLLLQRVNGGNRFTVLKTMPSFEELNSHRDVKEMNGEIAPRTTAEKAVREAREDRFMRPELYEDVCHCVGVLQDVAVEYTALFPSLQLGICFQISGLWRKTSLKTE